jgi:hypothetical protein
MSEHYSIAALREYVAKPGVRLLNANWARRSAALPS